MPGAYAELAYDPKLHPFREDGGWDADHCMITYNGRFYDCECPEGVDRVCDMPIYRNRGKTRTQWIAENSISELNTQDVMYVCRSLTPTTDQVRDDATMETGPSPELVCSTLRLNKDKMYFIIGGKNVITHEGNKNVYAKLRNGWPIAGCKWGSIKDATKFKSIEKAQKALSLNKEWAIYCDATIAKINPLNYKDK